MTILRSVAFLFCASLVFQGCATTKGKIYSYSESDAPDFISILPPENFSNDLAAPDTFRRVMASMLIVKGHFPMVSPVQEEALRKLGISDGGQLPVIGTRKLAEAMGADALLYGNVEDFSDINVAIYKQRKVTGRFQLVTPGNKLLWDIWGRGTRAVLVTNMDALAQSFAEGLATSVLEKMLKIHLLEETTIAGAQMYPKIPEWPKPLLKTETLIKRDIKKFGEKVPKFGRARKE